MDWNKNNTMTFIKLIRDRPVIWDSLSEEHKNKSKRHEAFDEVAKLMGISIKEVITKWTSLRGQFTRERKRIIGIRSRMGGGDKSISTIKWFAYNEMKSLMVGNITQNSLSYLENSMEEKFHSPVVPITFELMRPGTNPQPVASMTQPTKSVIVSKDTVGVPTRVQTSGLYSEPASKVIKDSKKQPLNAEDNLTSFASYIVAQVRQFHPRLQIKAKYEINQLLYQLEMENHECKSHPRIEREQDSSLSNYSSFNTESSPSPHNENYSNNIIYLENLQSPQIHSNSLNSTVQIEDQNSNTCRQPDPLNNISGSAGTSAKIKREE